MLFTCKGKNAPDHSERRMANWLSAPGNYHKYRAPRNGSTKENVCAEMSDVLYDNGATKFKRIPHNIQQKVEWFEKHMRRTILWASQTGQGVLESDGKQSFDQVVTRMFPYYFDLIDIFEDRAGMKAKTTSDEMDESSSRAGNKKDEAQLGEGNDGATAGASSKSKNGNKRNPKKRPPKPKDPGALLRSPEIKELVTLRKQELENKKARREEKKKKGPMVSDDILRKVALAEQFKRMVEALSGDRMQAVEIVPDFAVFLNEQEKAEYDSKHKKTP